MTAPDDLDGVAVLAALGPACAVLAAGADPWLALALAVGVGWGAAVAVGYMHLTARRSRP
jgi:ABC-type uncharacterized transport system permease subunit